MSQRPVSNTAQLIAGYDCCRANGLPMRFQVGKFTGNNPSVVAALRRRGYSVHRVPGAGSNSYEIVSGPKL